MPAMNAADFLHGALLLVTLSLLTVTGCAPQPVSTVEHPELAVVQISGRGTDLGRGFFVSADGLLVTTLHVIAGRDEVIVTPARGRPLRAELVQEDREADLAILKVPVLTKDSGEKIPFLF